MWVAYFGILTILGHVDTYTLHIVIASAIAGMPRKACAR